MIGDGYATHEIANRLHLSMKTVASHREHIKQKLDLKRGEELVRLAIHWQRHRDDGSAQPVNPPPPDPIRKVARPSRRRRA